jgi:Asp-tRNA(Asn)/Glu-tRNA(Gln) amidotransferase C subunit
MPVLNVLREDQVRANPPGARDQLLVNAPSLHAGQFMVPKIIE